MTPEQIKQLRERLGLSQLDFANQIREIDPGLRTDMATVSRWENGHTTPGSHATLALERLAAKETGDYPGTLSWHLEAAATIAEERGNADLALKLRGLAAANRKP